ncbi:MAG: hypothetical protein SH850_11900 [Planctomycetaceae bacterium]|nr:hypothetical protein [Planctomycetaceae bacterium]
MTTLNHPAGFYVTNVRLSSAPNQACCSDPRVLCPRCAQSALARTSHGNGLTLATRQFKEEDGLPVLNVTEILVNERRAELAQQQHYQNGQQGGAMTHHAAVLDHDEVEGLPLPVTNWAERYKELHRQHS